MSVLGGQRGVQASRSQDVADGGVAAPAFSEMPEVLDACQQLALTRK